MDGGEKLGSISEKMKSRAGFSFGGDNSLYLLSFYPRWSVV
jgi:hypothetical protein